MAWIFTHGSGSEAMGSIVSKDANHETIKRAFVRAQATVVDTSNIGRGVPDLHIGYGGTERWIETKGGSVSRDVKRLSSRCAQCNKTYPMHLKRPEMTCGEFVRQYVASRSAGVLSHRQDKWHREWRGHRVEVVRNTDDVDRVIALMEKEGRRLSARKGR